MNGARGTTRSSGPVRVAILADDLTGAGDTAVQFAEAGWPAFLQRSPQPPPDLPEVAAVARALNTRAMPDALAALRTRDAVEGQLDAGVTRLYVKIDSTMRGSVAAQLQGALEAWRTRHPGAFVVLCPAYPAMGRTISEGRLFVNGQSLERSPAGTDPVTPVRTSALTELVPGSAVVPALPRDALRAAMESAAGRPVVVVEAQTSEHVQTLAEVVAGFGPVALPAGSAGLALPLASAWHPHPGDVRPAPLPVVADRILVVVSSANEVSRRQVRACRDALGTRMQAVTLALEDVADDESAVRWASRLAVDPGAAVLALSAPAERLTGIGQVEAGARVAKGLAAAVHRLLERDRAGALLLIGGDGAEATLDRLGVGALRVLRRVVEGVPLSETMGSARAGLIVVTKAGGFGTDGTLLSVIEKLRGKKE